MSAQEGRPPDASIDHRSARVHRLEHVLRSYGVLTRARLYELSGADCWPSGPTFNAVLAEAVRTGRVRALGGVLFEAAPDGSGGHQPDRPAVPPMRRGYLAAAPEDSTVTKETTALLAARRALRRMRRAAVARPGAGAARGPEPRGAAASDADPPTGGQRTPPPAEPSTAQRDGRRA